MTRATNVLAALAAVSAAALAAVPAPSAEKPPPATAAQRKRSENILKQIGLAGHNYHDANGKLPGDVYSADGKPLLSWRVLLLPYLEEIQLYQQFKLDEPWDSENNKRLVEKMPKIYAPVRGKADAGKTFYQGFAGPGTLFEPNKPIKLTDITDGTSNTVWVVEAGEPVEWTKPGGLPFDPAKELPKLGGLFDGEFHFLLADGSVRRAKKDFDPAEFKKAITRAGGEVVDFGKIEK